jgi:predicted transcriptional regulator
MESYQPIIEGENPRKILSAFTQPLTSRQLSRKTGIPLDTVRFAIEKLTVNGLTICLNPKARNSRVYRLTSTGIQCRKKICLEMKLPFREYEQPSVDWDLYGMICFKHRTMIIKILTEPMQPSQIKRILRIHKHNIRISANNVRDIIMFFLKYGIVRPVKMKKKPRLQYELTDLGIKFRQILMQAEMSGSVKQ